MDDRNVKWLNILAAETEYVRQVLPRVLAVVAAIALIVAAANLPRL